MSGGVLFWVQHLLGSGHLRRVAAIARALAALGTPTTVASGGLPLARLEPGGARQVQLEPVRAADQSFAALATATGGPVDAALLARRQAVLEELVVDMAPTVVVTETFPFGRRILRDEALALLDAADRLARPPLVVASVRDVLQRRSRPERIAETIETAQSRFDAVLVHGDPRLMALAESFPAAALLGERVIHTGYIADKVAAPRGPGEAGHGEVVVSAGGGAVGAHLLAAAAGARKLSHGAGHLTWRLLAGEAGHAGAALPAPAEGIVVEGNRGDFATLLANCAVSVSQAGYNTVTDLLVAGTRAVLVPFAGQGETEQTDRAGRLAERGLATVVAEAALSPATLAEAVDAALAGPPPDVSGIDLDGTATSARLLAGWAARG